MRPLQHEFHRQISNLSDEDGTSPLFSPVRRSLGEGGKPFTGIYLFAEQKDKCHSNFEKILNAQVYLSFLSTYPHWEQSLLFYARKRKVPFNFKSTLHSNIFLVVNKGRKKSSRSAGGKMRMHRKIYCFCQSSIQNGTVAYFAMRLHGVITVQSSLKVVNARLVE